MPTMHVGDSDPGDAPTIAPGATPTPAARTPHPTDVSEARTMAPSSAPPPEAATLAPSTAGFDRTSDGDDDPLVGRSLDGYQILRKLGAGGMGAVYTAHQSSLDRDVALKVLPPVFAARPDMVARFTREALSAAQLNHHNIIQVYDVGKDRGVNFITMELVEGKTLGELVRDEGRFPLEDAAGYVLQAARGLHYAHERGIIHRDIKPANLMLNRQGVLKIADMGLAKKVGDAEIEATIGDSLHAPQATDGTPITSVRSVGTTPPPIAGGAAAELTQASIAMGTPAYMAPEQGEDAARVDGRADQYSLGCTLYYLCTGRAPYTGGSAIELITKHKTEPLPALDADVPNVPPSFNRILQKMLAKNRNERYATFKDCIRELEAYLGIESEKGVYTPREHHLAVLESAVENFYAAPALKRRKFALYGFFGAMAVLAIATGIDWGFAGVGIIMALMLLTPLAHFVINGVATHDFLFNRVRGSLLGMRLRNWAIGAVGAAFGLGILWLVGWLPIWIGFGAAAVGLAFAYQFGVMRPLRAQREEPLQQMRDALKELRIKGVSEEALHDFVARFAPRRWEEFFEELFGYENMILARQKLAAAKAGRPRVKHATWREPIVRGIERLEQARREAKEQAELARVEQERLEAEGVSSEDAHKQAEEEAMRFRQEQLHKVAAKDVDWTQMQTTGSRRRLRLGTPMGRAIRALMGVAIIALWLLESQWGGMVTLPEQATSVLNTYVYAEGIGYAAYLYGLIAGICVLVSALSRRMFVPWLVALGAILLIFNGPIVNMVDNPDFNAWTSVLVAGGLIAFGIGTSVLAAATGKEF